ncbi:MAG: DNA recombination protein RmuC, partial [Deltaproteobacteria bacterium]|nr:DNA recombination protein RmuC [Deltaproteobacteria bacterium]
MNSTLLVIAVILLIVVVVLQIVLLLRRSNVDMNPVQQALQWLGQSFERTERAMREEIARNREETAGSLQQSREELSGSLKGVGDTLLQQVGALTQTNDQKFDQLREEVR